ncbi:hypothetical protein BT96DRAFT_946761 [Gymnopus androsaceus JB14]|uniref:Uncharacterized protein n=1 Tax=Gymnopus androsaceus JB14 TaxID=1447944 RepID=A0A6A4GVN9_9AGAR|nr:hypothetical protein BT96DRAFT_946761 [Gymnopus androsaceus JB14]
MLRAALMRDIPCADKLFPSIRLSKNYSLIQNVETIPEPSPLKQTLGVDDPLLLHESETEEYLEEKRAKAKQDGGREVEERRGGKYKVKIKEIPEKSKEVWPNLGLEDPVLLHVDELEQYYDEKRRKRRKRKMRTNAERKKKRGPNSGPDTESQSHAKNANASMRKLRWANTTNGPRISFVGAAAFTRLAEAGCETFTLHITPGGEIHEWEEVRKEEALRAEALEKELEESAPKPLDVERKDSPWCP